MSPEKRKSAGSSRRASSSKPVRPEEATASYRRRVGYLFLLVLAVLLVWEFFSATGLKERLFSTEERSRQTITDSEATLSGIFSDQVLFWRDRIEQWAAEYAINPNVIALVIQIESCGDSTAISGAGALGLMQVMPFHFEDGENMLEPDTNVRRGMAVFTECLTQFARFDLGLALACYNGGPGVTVMAFEDWVPETRYYYEWATGLWDDIVHGRQTSQTLDSWLAAGGQQLCNRASATQTVLLRMQ